MLIKLSEFYKKNRNLSMPHKGIVVDNVDPLKLGRIKCQVRNLIESEDTEALPWLCPENPLGKAGSPDSGGPEIPAIDSEVTVIFPTQDIYAGFFRGGWTSELTAPGSYNEDYPNSVGNSDALGNQVVNNKAKGITEFKHFSGSTVQFDKSGNLTLIAKGNIKFQSEDGKSTVDFDYKNGTIKLAGKNSIEIEGDETKLSSDKFTEEIGEVNKEVQGSESYAVLGGRKVSIGGSESKSITSDRGLTVAGKTSELYSQDYSATYGMGKEETIATMNYLISLLLGNYDVEVIAGDVILKTMAGNIELGNLIGKLAIDIAGNYNVEGLMTTIKALTTLTLQGTVIAELKAPMVNIGSSPIGMVLTNVTEPLTDNITGKPTIGCATILAGP